MTTCSGEFVTISPSSPGGSAFWSPFALELHFGAGHVVAEPSKSYSLCWCRPLGHIGCNVASDFAVLAAELTVQGPSGGQEKSCFVGQRCAAVHDVQGIGLLPVDYISVKLACGEDRFLDGLPQPGFAKLVNGSRTFAFTAAGECYRGSMSQLLDTFFP
jgi:hypothetical protein